MQITLELPDNILLLSPEQQREKIFLAYKEILKRKISTDSSTTQISKWAKIVQRVENDPVHLAGYSEQLKTDMQKFRNNFELKNE